MGDKTKIDWFDASWNPVTGCLHGCEYCYARRIANRFGFLRDDGKLHELDEPYTIDYYEDGEVVRENVKQPYPNSYAPTLHRYKLDEPQKWKKPRTIFVCSMADLFGEWVPDEWIEEVFDACQKAPQHRYLFLTKNPQRYISFLRDKKLLLTVNCWYGSTISSKYDKGMLGWNTFLSIEPIMEDFSDAIWHPRNNWIIIGAETGNRKGKVIPKKEWILPLAKRCRKRRVPIFMKESLRGIMGEDFRQEFPWEV